MYIVLFQEDVHRVQLEIDALKTLSHRHICQLYEIIETPALFCLVMEVGAGSGLLSHLLDRLYAFYLHVIGSRLGFRLPKQIVLLGFRISQDNSLI